MTMMTLKKGQTTAEYTNLESEKGFNFFQKFMKSSGAIDRLEELGIEEGDTVRVGDYLEFDYYRA